MFIYFVHFHLVLEKEMPHSANINLIYMTFELILRK